MDSLVSTDRSLIALDADGVLVDYHEGYAMGWEKAFGERPKVRNANAYHPADYWDVPLLDAQGRRHFQESGLTAEVWASMPAIPGALSACQMLQSAGYRLVCVTALRPAMQSAREANLRSLGFSMEAVYAVGPSLGGNPKKTVLQQLRPAAFVDDYLRYLQGLPSGTWRALIEGRPHANPNRDPSLEDPHSRHLSLCQFAVWWTSRLQHRK
jgi:hypothetical protein